MFALSHSTEDCVGIHYTVYLCVGVGVFHLSFWRLVDGGVDVRPYRLALSFHGSDECSPDPCSEFSEHIERIRVRSLGVV